jgi:hypothetical protein
VKRRPKAKAVKRAKVSKPAGKTKPSEPTKKRSFYREMLVSARQSGNAVGALIAKLADKHGMSPRAVATQPLVLKEAGLTLADATATEVGVATYILSEVDKNIADRVAAYNERVKPFCKQEPTWDDEPVTTPKFFDEPKKPKRPGIFGYKTTAVLRWMGKDGMKFAEAKKVLLAFGVTDIADATIHAQLRAGVKGERGPAAPLTKDEQEKIRDAAR